MEKEKPDLARQLVSARLHPRVLKCIFKDCDDLDVSPATVIEMMAKETHTAELQDFEPGKRINTKKYTK